MQQECQQGMKQALNVDYFVFTNWREVFQSEIYRWFVSYYNLLLHKRLYLYNL